MSRIQGFALMLFIVSMLHAPGLWASCDQGTPTVSLSLSPLLPDNDGIVKASILWSFPRPPQDYSQKVELWIK